MDYIKQGFNDGDILTTDKLNYIEEGIYTRQSIPNEELNNSFICAYGGIKSSGLVVTKNTTSIYGATTYIHCGDAPVILVRMMIETTNSGYGLAFYDENRNIIQFIANNKGSSLSSELREIEVPNNAIYFRTTYFSFNHLEGQEDFYALIPHRGKYFSAGKKVYQEGHINYSTFVNQAIANVSNTAVEVQDIPNIKATTCVLFLPKSYKPIGNPTPSIILCMGANGYLTQEDYRGNGDTWMMFISLLLQAGYAVIGCQGAYDNIGKPVKPSGAPQAVRAHHQAFTWAKKHYNLAEKTNYCGCSMGGLIAMNAPLLFNNEINTVIMLAGMINTSGYGWAQDSTAKKQIAELYGFSSYTTYEADKVGNYDPMKRVKTLSSTNYILHPFPPTKMWHGKADKTLSNYSDNQKYVTALQNSGNIAEIRLIDDCPHDLARGVYIDANGNYITIAVEELINWLNRFNYPIEKEKGR